MTRERILRGDKNRPLAWFLCGRKVAEVAPVSKDARALPRQLVIAPGVYRVFGRTYSLEREGLYRFLFPGRGNRQRIVYRRNPWALLSGMAWLMTYGNRDDETGFARQKRRAMTEKLIVTCGNASQFGHDLLREHGIRSRVVQVGTVRELNNYDNEHLMLEVWWHGKWNLFDITQHVAFRHRGRRLSLWELLPRIGTNAYDLQWLALATDLAIGHFTEKGYDYGLFMEINVHSEATLRKWYQRVIMIPEMRDRDGAYYTTGNPAVRRKIAREPYYSVLRYLAPDDFRARFYGCDRRGGVATASR